MNRVFYDSELRLASTLPEGDANALTGIPDAPQARAWMLRKVEDYKNHISTLLEIHNSVARINTLPTEIFQNILVNIPSEVSWCNASWMLSLGSVCRHWRSAVLATPEYWVRGLHTVMDYDFYDCYKEEDLTHGRNLFLTRSAPCPLEILMAYSLEDFGLASWYAFDDHFDRVTVFEVTPNDSQDLEYIFDMMSPWSSQNMKRLERLKLDGRYVKVSTKRLEQWRAEGVPHLRHLEITSDLFCRATTVPSLHTVILMRPPRDIRSLPQLLSALENCPALATLRLELAHKDDTFQNMTLKRVLDLPKLCNLAVGGGLSDVRCFLTALSFPSTTLVEVDVLDTGNEQDKGLVLPNVLPRSPSIGAHPMIKGVNRLCFHSKSQVRSEDERAIVSMRAYIRGKERLRISPAFWLHSADHFLQILKLFRECRVTELVLDLRYAAGDMDGGFWGKFFEALPDVLRLQLLSPTVECRAMKREIAKHYLSSCGVPHLVPENGLVDFICRIAPPRPAVSLAWVLPCADHNDVLQMDELEDVQQVLMGHRDDESIALQRLELYLTTLTPDPSGKQAFDVKEACPDGVPRVIDGIRIPGSRGLEDAAEVVVFASRLWGFEFAENNHEPDVDVTDDERMVVDDD